MTTSPEHLCDLANKMNTERAQRGIRERYKVVMGDGLLRLDTYTLPPNVDAHSASAHIKVPG